MRAASVVLLVAVASGACWDEPTVQPWAGRIDSTLIAVGNLPAAFDTLLTFRYGFAAVSADSVLVALLDSGIAVREAWRPMDNLCADPLGPRFTVQLRADDPALLDHDFERGEGRLHCATALMYYLVSAAPLFPAVRRPFGPRTAGTAPPFLSGLPDTSAPALLLPQPAESRTF